MTDQSLVKARLQSEMAKIAIQTKFLDRMVNYSKQMPFPFFTFYKEFQ